VTRAHRTVCLGLALLAIVHEGSPLRAQPAESLSVVFDHAIPNLPGKQMVAVIVTYPPGGRSAPHHHARSAFVYAHVLSGTISSQVDDGPVRNYKVGEGFYEAPGAHHRVSANASASEPASLLAVFVVDSGDTPLTVPDSQ
jgi:quercetin dioxygenase-like cupin family protein